MKGITVRTKLTSVLAVMKNIVLKLSILTTATVPTRRTPAPDVIKVRTVSIFLLNHWALRPPARNHGCPNNPFVQYIVPDCSPFDELNVPP